jgi:Caspase domain
MTAVLAIVLSAALGGATASAAGAPVPVQRFLLVVGANAGGGDRAKLQYAISDAERFARVMVELGGVLPANEVVLKQPKLRDLLEALDQLSTRVRDARSARDAGRVEVVVYYSGHADDQGLLLGGERYAYRSLRERLDAIPADVRIAVLDACASGAFTRIKGGKLRPPFLVDESANMRGHAFLTSSAETEAAQESDRIRASYFTHYLISGFRGAADASGDGKITLSEAYQFAFNETLGRTVDTRAGAQHPSYDISLSGSGDVVMTDVRQTTATLILGEELDGRFFVRNAAQELVVELYKPFGRKVELGLEPGTYEVRIDRDKTSMIAKTKIAEGATLALDARQFGPVALEATRRRGDAPQIPLAVAGRHRIGVLIGGSSGSTASIPQGVSAVEAVNAFGGLQYTAFPREDLGVTFAFLGRAVGSSAVVNSQGSFSDEAALLSVPVGVRWNPFTSRHPSSPLKPFVAATIGPVFGAGEQSFVSGRTVSSSASTETTVGGDVLLGADFHVARWFSVTVSGGYNWMADFSRPIGTRDNYSGAEFGFGFGFLFGKGR